MRDAVGTTWIFGLVISFTLIFSGFLVLALSYAKAYRIKNEMTSIIEKYEGLTTYDTLSNQGSISIINNYLKNSNYGSTGTCNIDENANTYGFNLDDESLTLVTDSNSKNKFNYCISYTKTNNCTTLFRITVFYDFNLPVLGRLRKYSINGQTNEISHAYMNGREIGC